MFSFQKRVLLAAGVFAVFTTAAEAIELTSISIEAPANAHLCKALGGQDKDITVTVNHEKKAGQRISVKMIDNVSNGRTVNHKTATVKSEADGSTTFTHNYLAPCNTTRNSISQYSFIATSAGSKSIRKRWMRYNSATGKMSR